MSVNLIKDGDSILPARKISASKTICQCFHEKLNQAIVLEGFHQKLKYSESNFYIIFNAAPSFAPQLRACFSRPGL